MIEWNRNENDGNVQVDDVQMCGTHVKSKCSNFGNCLTISASTFQVGISDAVKSSTSKLAKGDKSPAEFIFEFGSETVVNSFRWLQISICVAQRGKKLKINVEKIRLK